MRTIRHAMLGATIGVAVAAGVAQAEDLRVTVTYYSAATGPIFEGMAKDFQAANPDVDVQIEVVSWDNIEQKLTTDIQGGTAPDIAIIGTRNLLEYSSNDVAEPLDDYLTKEMRGRFIGSFLEPSTIDGQVYGLPVAASARAMYYNRKLLADVGVTEPPATWDELVAAARKVKEAGGNAYGFGLQGKEIETDAYWYYALWTHGGELLLGNRSGINSEAGITAATLYKSMIDEGLTEPDPTGLNRQDVEALFKQGRAAIILSGPWLRGQLKEEAPDLDYGIAPMPRGTVAATYGVTDSIIMFQESEVKETAWKFLADTAFSPKWRNEFTVKEGFLPVTKAEAENSTFRDDPQLKAFTDLLPQAKFAPLIPAWEQMADATMAALQTIYLGEAEPKAALDEAAEKINGLLE